MAGDWIKIEHVLPDKPEVVQMSNILGVDQDLVVGKLVRLWVWADQQSVDGTEITVDTEFIDRLARMPGFSNAMELVGWLDGKGGTITLPNFERHNGVTAKERARKAKVNRGTRRSQQPDAKPTPKPKANPVDEVPIPESLQTPEFLDAWETWKRFRKEKRAPVTPTMAVSQLKQFSGWGPARAVAAIEHTILKGWQGIQEPQNRNQERDLFSGAREFLADD